MRHFLLLILLSCIPSATFGEDVGSANNNFQCNSVPGELFSRCRTAIAANKPFFYGYLEEVQDCSSLSDSTERNKCIEVVGNGHRFAIQTDEYESQSRHHNPSKRLTTQEIQSAQMERIAKALERSALLSTVQLVLIGIGCVATVALITLSVF